MMHHKDTLPTVVSIKCEVFSLEKQAALSQKHEHKFLTRRSLQFRQFWRSVTDLRFSSSPRLDVSDAQTAFQQTDTHTHNALTMRLNYNFTIQLSGEENKVYPSHSVPRCFSNHFAHAPQKVVVSEHTSRPVASPCEGSLTNCALTLATKLCQDQLARYQTGDVKHHHTHYQTPPWQFQSRI